VDGEEFERVIGELDVAKQLVQRGVAVVSAIAGPDGRAVRHRRAPGSAGGGR
jgi:hypothetical protein